MEVNEAVVTDGTGDNPATAYTQEDLVQSVEDAIVTAQETTLSFLNLVEISAGEIV